MEQMTEQLEDHRCPSCGRPPVNSAWVEDAHYRLAGLFLDAFGDEVALSAAEILEYDDGDTEHFKAVVDEIVAYYGERLDEDTLEECLLGRSGEIVEGVGVLCHSGNDPVRFQVLTTAIAD